MKRILFLFSFLLGSAFAFGQAGNVTIGQIDTTSANGVVNKIRLATNLTGYQKTIYINAANYCVGDSSTDNTTAMRSMFALAAAKGATVYFPKGSYLISDTINIPKAVNILGNGGLSPYTGTGGASPSGVYAGGNSIIIQTASNKDGLVFNADGSSIEGMTIKCTGSSPTAGSGIMVLHGNGFRMTNTYIGNFYANMTINSGVEFVITGSQFTNPKAYNLIVNGTINDEGDNSITNNWFNSSISATAVQVYCTAAAGLRFVNNKMHISVGQPTPYYPYGGIFVNQAKGSGDLYIYSNSIEACTGYGIKFRLSDTTQTFSNIHIAHNQIAKVAVGNSHDIDIYAPSIGHVSNISISDNIISNNGVYASVVISNVSNVDLHGNQFDPGISETYRDSLINCINQVFRSDVPLRLKNIPSGTVLSNKILVDNGNVINEIPANSFPINGSTAVASVTDFNDVTNTQPGWNGLLLGTATNGPGGGDYYYPYIIEFGLTKDGTHNLSETLYPYGSSGTAKTWVRTRFSGTWGSWVQAAGSGTGGTVTSITPGWSFTSTTPITGAGTLTEDSTKVQTVANFFPKADTRYLQLTGGSLTNTGTQLTLKYDGTHYATFAVNASGTLVISPSNTAMSLVGDFYGINFYSRSNSNASYMNMTGTGTVISQNIAGTNTALKINQVQGTGDIEDWQFNSVTKGYVDYNGNVHGNGFTASSLGTGIVHSSSVGLFSSSLIVNSDITSGTITPASMQNSDDNTYRALQLLGSSIKGYTVGFPVLPSSNAIALTSGTITWTAVYVPVGQTLTGIKVDISTAGSYTSTGYNGVALYSISGGTLTQVATSTTSTTVWTGSGWVSIPFASTYTATEGVYYVALLYQQSAQTTAPKINAISTPGGYPALDFTNSYKLGGTSSGTTLPSSQAASGITAASTQYHILLY